MLHVATALVVVYGEGVLPPEPQDKDRLRERLQQVVTQDTKLPLEHCLIDGDAATEILRLAGETKCDLIVMGTHERTGLGRLLMGSVAEQVVRKAPCPVLTVKAPQRQPLPGEEAAPATAETAASGER